MLLSTSAKTLWNFLAAGQIRNLKNNNVIDVYNLATKTVGQYGLNSPSSTNQEWQVNYVAKNTYILTTQLNMGISLAFRNGTATLTNYSTSDTTQLWVIQPCTASLNGKFLSLRGGIF